MRIRKDILATRDIDWFCIISGIPVHVASAGGVVIPDLINNRNQLIKSQLMVDSLPDIYNQVFVNTDVIRRKIITSDEYDYFISEDDETDDDNLMPLELTIDERITLYASSFVEYAHKGFYCFDRSDLSNPDSTIYDIIAFPNKCDFTEINLMLPSVDNRIFNQIRQENWLENNLSRFENIDLIEIINLKQK